MKRLSAQTLALAHPILNYFIRSGGEVGTSDLACLHGLDEEAVVSWALSKDYLRNPGEEPIDLDVLPELWADFADESLVCAAFHAALQERLLEADTTATEWVARCAESLRRYQKHAR